MARSRIGLITSALLASLSAAASAQDAGRANVPLWGEAADPAPQVRKKEHAFGVSAGLEWWRAQLDFTDSSSVNPSLPSSALEQNVDFYAQHTSAIVSLEYSFLGLAGAEIRAHAGLGYETMETTIDVGGAGPSTSDTRYDESFLFEVGAAFVYKLTKADVRGSLLYRMGDGEADRPSPEDITYEYTLIRVAAEGGIEAMPGVRPFLGLRYTLYESEWEIDDPGNVPDVVTYELELDQPFGVFVGIELGSGDGAGRLEIDFIDVDTVGIAVSVGIGF